VCFANWKVFAKTSALYTYLKKLSPLTLGRYKPPLVAEGLWIERNLAQSALVAQRGCGAGRRASFVGEPRRPVTFNLMLAVDDSELTEGDREFLEHWADALQVPIEVLVLRIVEAAIDGDQYIKGRPED